MAHVDINKNIFKTMKRHGLSLYASAVLVLLASALLLYVTTLWTTGPAFFFGQVLFVVMVFGGVSLLVAGSLTQGR